MSYERKKLQIIGGSWNLNPPGDKVSDKDYLLAQNWRPDRDGKLVSRWGFLNYASYSGAGQLHSAVVFGANVYWGSAAGALFFGGNPGAITTGFDGNRLGMAGMLGWMWIINRAKQGRHNVTNGFSNYGITAPGSGPVASPGASGNLNGTYSVFVTFVYKDSITGLVSESNPQATGTSVTVANQQISLTSIPTSADTRVNGRNIYLSGGTLGSATGQAYLAVPFATSYASIEDNTSNGAIITLSDLAITNLGIVMPTTNDPPPAASGVVGPYFSRLLAFSTASNVNRLFFTPVGQPQYWPGSANPAIGNWVDVGQDGEAILWVTLHTNVAVIYKQRSVWMLVGDPVTGYLTQVDVTMGLTNAFAVVNAGDLDYFVGPNTLNAFNLTAINDIAGNIRPLLNTVNLRVLGPDQAPPGNIATINPVNGPPNSIVYKCALGYAMGKLYIGYVENTVAPQYGAPILVYHEDDKRWFYYRSPLLTSAIGGFLFDGSSAVAMGQDSLGNGYATSIDDFSVCATQDPSSTALGLIYQSHYEDAGLPDNQKNWLEVVVDCEVASPDTLNVTAYFDNGTATANLQGTSPAGLPLGTIAGNLTGKRQQFSFPVGPWSPLTGVKPDGYLAKNISITITNLSATKLVVIHNVFLYYYPEARLAAAASSLPTDLGIGNLKQCKELQLDIDASQGAVNVNIYSDQPGNVLAVNQALVLSKSSSRAVLKLPFSTITGFLWRLALTAQSAAAPFRLYAARLLMRPIGVYVEAYESAQGFVWDSMEQSFESAITHVPRVYLIALAASPIKRFREISLQIDTFNNPVTLTFLTDLPGNAQAVRSTTTINSGNVGRRFLRVPLPAGTNPPIEGRFCRVQISGTSAYILYELSVELLAVGLYIEAYEAAGGAVYDSREQDLGTPNAKEARELELDIETTGAVSAQLISDISSPFTQSVTTTGRQKVLIPLTINAGLEQFIDARLLRLIISGANAFRLYDARVKLRAYGQYVSTSEATTGALWDSADLDLGTQTVKQLREVEIEISATAGFTVTVYTDLPGNVMAARVISALNATSGRTKVQVPLIQGGVPDNYIFGRLVRVTLTSTATFKLFGARIHVRPIGVYVESYEAAGGAVWDSLPQDLGNAFDKSFDELRLEMDTDGASTCTAYTDLPGESMASRISAPLTTGATSRHWATVPLGNLASVSPPWSIEGRSIRLIASSSFGFRIYRAQVRAARVGRYLAAATAQGNDPLTTLEFDFASERVKQFKKLELDIRADGQVTLNILANPNGQMVQMFTHSITTPNGRATLYLPLPPGIRGRLLRILVQSSSAARIYKLRAWNRPLNEPKADWGWADYPLEESEVVPAWQDIPVPPTPSEFKWADLPVPPTPPEWQWATFPVSPTPPGTQAQDPAQWIWAKVLSAEETPEEWKLIDVPMDVLNG